jgi:hypothetical protein
MSVSLDGSWTAGACAIELPATKKHVKRNEANIDRWYFIVYSLLLFAGFRLTRESSSKAHLIRAGLQITSQYLNVRKGSGADLSL